MPSDYIHQLAARGDSEEMSEFLRKFRHHPGRLAKLLITKNKAGFYPLYAAFTSLPQKNLSVAIQLLEAGAPPHARDAGGLTVIHFLISEHSLAEIRLLLWFDPDYEEIKDCAGESALTHLKKEFSHAEQLEIIKTARDSKRVKRLIEKAKRALIDENHEKAAGCYQTISSIYAKHHRIQETLPHPWSDINYHVKKNKFLLRFYQERSTTAKEQSYVALDLACKAYDRTQLHLLSEQYQQAKRLERMADLARELKWSAKAIECSQACAKLLMQLEAMEYTVKNPLAARTPSLFSPAYKQQAAETPEPVLTGQSSITTQLRQRKV